MNRKDVPSGVDEKQLIDIAVPTTDHEVHKVTLKGSNLSGTFHLSVGGKRSRALAADASAADVGAAVREMLSNCEGDIGLPTDSAGNTFECFSERGYMYRGLAHTTDEGDECLPWTETDFYDPWLVVAFGMDGNLCRNPDFRRSGPWCVNSKKQVRSCALARCGGTEQQVKITPALSTFEDEEPNTEALPFTTSFEERNGVTPRVVKSEAFCGSGSLYFHNAWGQLRNDWRFDEGRDAAYDGATKGLFPFGTKKFPYICMAYKIPASTRLNMLLRIQHRDEKGVLNNVETWKTIKLTHDSYSGSHALIGQWQLIADNTWRYDCLDLQYMLDMAAQEDDNLFLGQDHLVKDIIFWTNGIPSSTYSDDNFFLDEFSISKTIRTVKQTAYPRVPLRKSSSPLRLVNVTKHTDINADERTWSIELTSDDCSAPSADFVLDVSSLTGSLQRAEVHKVQDHSQQIAGNVVVDVLGQTVAFSPYSAASEVKAAFEQSGVVGESVEVMRTGTCQTGFGWMVTMTHFSGDVPLMTAMLSEEPGDTGVQVHVYPYINGGHLMGPISVDYLYEAVTDNNVQVVINDAAADCVRDALNASLCRFLFDDSLTPTVTQLQSGRTSTGTYSVTITGSSFTVPANSPSGAAARVKVASDFECVVSSASDMSIVCQITFPFVGAGMHDVQVIVPGKGAARGSIAFVYELEIAAVVPSQLNRDIVNTMTISGAGFSPILQANTLSIGGTSCEPIKVTAQVLQCTLGPKASGTRRRQLLATVDVQLTLPASNDGTAPTASSNAVFSISTAVPVITSTTPSVGAVGGGYTVTISGSSFSTTLAGNTVLLGSTECMVTQAASTSIKCTAGAGPIGTGSVTVMVDAVGVSDAASSPQFEYQLSVDLLTPAQSVFGFGGGNHITVSGKGFVSGASSDQYATPVVAVAGLQTFVVGVYMPSYTPEIHEMVLTGQFVNAVQRVSVPTTAYFVLSLFDRETDRLSRNVDQLELQVALSKLMPAASPSVVVVSTLQGWQVEFPADVGNIGLLSGQTCASLAGSCSASGITVTKIVAGSAPRGSVGLLLGRYVHEWQEQRGNSTFNMSQVAWKDRLNVSVGRNMQQQVSGHSYFGTVRVVQRRANTHQVSWQISYLDLTGAREVPDIDDSSIIGGNVTVRRVQQGILLPAATFQMRLGGVLSEHVPLNATAAEVEQAVKSAFPDVLSASVFALDDHPGKLLDRAYPRQWVVKLERQDVAGASVDRCTSPLYVDWDPLACPSVAPDLFLHHYPWYWPASLPRPSDLGQDSIKADVQRACDAEARALQLRPSLCQARIPLEALPICGQGSGINPPCWMERFSTAKVRHSDGQDIVYGRDDSMVSSDTVKGYRFWTRTDLVQLQEAQSLSVNHSLSFPSGVDVRTVYTRAQQLVECSASDVTPTTMTATVASLMAYGQSALDMVQSDFLLQPVRHLSFSREDPLFADKPDVTFQSGLSLNGDIAHLGAAVPLAFSSNTNPPTFSVEIWVLMTHSAAGAAPLLQNVGADGFSGYALVLSSTGNWQFYLAAGCEASQNADIQLPVQGFSVVIAPAAVGMWSQVALSFDGVVQSIYVDGLLKSSSHVPGPYRQNAGANMVFAGACGAWLGSPTQSACNHDSVEFVTDEVLFYNLAVPDSALAAHASILDTVVNAEFRLKSHSVLSPCTSAACAMQATTSSTARVMSLQPAQAYDGASITVRGEGFSKGTVEGVRLGSGSCDSITVVSDTQLTCTARLSSGGSGPVRVVLQDLGASFSAETVEWISGIESISPTDGSLLGGTRITISGFGIVSDVMSLAVTVDALPCIVQISTGSSLQCVLGELARPSNTASRVLPVMLYVEGKPAQCRVAAGCSITVSLMATPALRSLQSASGQTHTSMGVTEGSILILGGVALPSTAASVHIGSAACIVQVQNATNLVCRLDRAVGGHHRVRVLFAVGYAADLVSQCCTTVVYDVSVSAVALNAGARWGGQSITVTGEGFAFQKDAVSTSDNSVFVGGRRARVLEASYNKMVLETPGLLDTPALGLEHEHIWKKIRHCGLPGKEEIECLGVHLRSCAAVLSWGTPADIDPKLPAIAPNNMLLALPGSDGLSLDASLVDGDASTVWLSKPGSDTLKLILDLGVSPNVTHILIRWAGRSAAAQIRVSAGAADPSTCSPEAAFLEELVAWRPTTAAASGDSDVLDTIDLGGFLFSPRVFMVELRGLRSGLVSFGIRDVIIVDKLQLPFPSRQPILVEVGGVEASCGAQNVCSFNYSSAPEVVQVSPTKGTAGILITVNVTGLNVANCAANTVSISNVECAVQSCGGVDGQEGWIVCALGRMSGGTYAVAVTVSGAPAANNGVVFTYPVLISAVTPAAGGYGGKYKITVTGDGFHTDLRRISVMLCGFPCKVTRTDMTSLECVPEALSDSASSPGASNLDIAISNGRDDATEDIESKAIVTDSGMIGGYLQPWGYEWSARVVYMRFSAVDIAQGMHVAAARLQVRAADPSCQKDSQIRIWAEVCDSVWLCVCVYIFECICVCVWVGRPVGQKVVGRVGGWVSVGRWAGLWSCLSVCLSVCLSLRLLLCLCGCGGDTLGMGVAIGVGVGVCSRMSG